MNTEKIIMDGISLKDFKSEVRELVSAAVREEIKKINPEPKPEGYHSVKGAADILNVSVSSINNYVKQGRLIAYKIGGRVLFKADEIEKSFSKVQSMKFKHAV